MDLLFGILGALALSVVGIAVVVGIMAGLVYSAEQVLQIVRETLDKESIHRDKE